MSDAASASITIGRREIPYRLIRSASARKLKLAMTMDEFSVTAPAKAGDEDIQKALSQKHKWIIENYASLQEKYEQTHKIARFRTGAKIPYWGRLTALRTQLADVEAPRVSYKHGLYVEHPNCASSQEHDDAVERALHDYLKQRFIVVVRALADDYSKRLGVAPKSVRVTEMSKRWGSCTAAGNVSLDWRLVYAPKRVAAYVVAHELTHIRVSNHSRKYWNLLLRVYGEHHREHQWLISNEHLLGYRKLMLDSIYANYAK